MLTLHAKQAAKQIFCQKDEETNGDWYLLPYFPENISNTEGGEGCLKKQVDSRVFLPKKNLNNSRSFTTGKTTISEERKRRWKQADRHLQQKKFSRPSLVIYFFFPSPPIKTKNSYNSILLAKLHIFHIKFLWKTRNYELGTALGCPNFEILWLPRKSQPGTEKSNPPISSKWW
jgi:hypothetical protein